jgi:hypothetical protein
MIRLMAACLGLLVWVELATAAPLQSSLRPVARPVQQQAATLDLAAAILSDVSYTVVTRRLGRSLRPVVRPKALNVVPAASKRLPKRGSVCGDRSLRGEEVGRVPGKLQGCGVKNAIRLREVAGVALRQPSVMDCGTAKALKTWVERA